VTVLKCGPTLSFAQCNREWMIVVSAESFLALKDLLRQQLFVDVVSCGRLLACLVRRFTGNTTTYQLRADRRQTTSGPRSGESRQHCSESTVEMWPLQTTTMSTSPLQLCCSGSSWIMASWPAMGAHPLNFGLSENWRKILEGKTFRQKMQTLKRAKLNF